MTGHISEEHWFQLALGNYSLSQLTTCYNPSDFTAPKEFIMIVYIFYATVLDALFWQLTRSLLEAIINYKILNN